MRRWSRPTLVGLFFVPLFVVSLFHLGCKPSPAPTSAGADGYLLCFWNVENLFDDRADGRTQPGDKEYDGWLATNPAMLKLKLDKLSEAILKLNDGRGPDILAIAAVES